MVKVENLYSVSNFPYNSIKNADLQKRRRGNQGSRNNERKYKNLFCAFDIETTNDLESEQAFMYIWQFQIEDRTIIGRTWDEFNDCLSRIKTQLDDDVFLVIYVHNLSFEFSFLKGIYDFDNEEVFAIQPRKVLKCEMYSHFEFRCSYLLTNMSLAVFTDKMGVEQKLSGDEFDYSIQRYPWTELTEQELLYCVVDVRALVAALKVYFSIEHDTFYTIPLTSTGFVRRDVRAAMRHYNKNDLREQMPDYDLFVLLREAFRGGNTHANRFYSEQIIENVTSYDRVSSYPDVQINELFPMSGWIHEADADFERVCRKIYKQHRAGIMRVGFQNIRLGRSMWGCPYIPKHKCRNLSNNHYNDNGRILFAEYLEITLTDIDFRIIMDEYIFDGAAVLDFYHARYGRLPKPLRDTVLKFYRAKTELKNVEGQELFYMLSKAKLNSIYGMSVQSPVKQNILYNEGIFSEATDAEPDLLAKSNKKAFSVYSWGVWTTAHARYQLETAIKLVGNRFVYCDTDSVKFIDDGKVSFADYNKKRKQESEKNGGVATDQQGKKHYLGLYENEGTYRKFITMGAKKYGYVDKNGKLSITIAGVNKSKGAKELESAGGLRRFREGFVFREAGGTESVYNDFPEVSHIVREGQEIPISSNVLIRDSTYTLGVTGEYRRILENPEIWLDVFQ